jgi:trehalose synthase-fused probable maltokinase
VSLSAALTPVLERSLPDFLPRQRWFAGKARPLAGVAIEDLAWLSPGPDARALALAEARYRDGGQERYCLLLSFPESDGPALIARDATPSPTGRVAEAGGDPDAVRALLGGLGSDAEIPTDRGGRIRCGDAVPPGDDPRWVERMLAERAAPLGAEQSNTSLRFSDRYIFKLFRKIDSGENPEVEIGRFLTTRTGFRAMPALRGSVTYRPPDGDPCTLGVLQDWVPAADIGWNAVIARLRRVAAGAESSDGVAEEMAGLGRTTGELHLALGSDATLAEFAPEPPTAADREAWAAGLATRAERVRQLFADSTPGDPRTIRLKDAFLRHVDRPGGVAADVLPPDAPFRKIRVHGDYHLGQTLRAPNGFVILDFEGEPGRPLRERRLKQCALKDVAGMTRSFDYAWETASEGADAKTPQVFPVSRMRESFVSAYRAAVRPARPPLVPEGREAFFAWLDFFELDKALYEIEYELNNRPGWVHIPLSGAVRILERESE